VITVAKSYFALEFNPSPGVWQVTNWKIFLVGPRREPAGDLARHGTGRNPQNHKLSICAFAGFLDGNGRYLQGNRGFRPLDPPTQ